MKKLLLSLSILALLAACRPAKEAKTTEVFELPAVDDIAMYQVNPRVFAPENSLNAVAARIDSIRDLGVNIMWVIRSVTSTVWASSSTGWLTTRRGIIPG